MAGSQRGIKAGRAYVEIGVNDQIAAGLRKAQTRLNAFAKGMRSAGLALTGAAAAVGTPAAVASVTFAEFEQRMARVRALTGATGEEFGRLEAKAQELGRTTVYTARQAADAMSFFALAGFKTDQILAAIGPTLDMAAAGLMDVTQAADVAVKIMAGAGYSADELTGAVDIMTKAMTTANTDLTMLGDAMKYVGPVAKNAGISFEELTAAVQMLSNAGIQGQMAGTTLRGAILSLTDPSAEATGALRQLGVSVLDSRGNMRSLADIIDDMASGMERLSLGTGQRVGMVGRIFDARQAAGFTELLSQGADKMREMTAALRASKGTAGRIAGIQLDTLRGDVTILRSAAEGLQISFGQILGPMIRTVARSITDVIGVVSKWTERNARLIRGVALVTVGVGALGVGLLGVSLGATIAAKVLGGLALASKALTVTLSGITAVLASAVSPMGLLIGSATALGSVLVIASGKGGIALQWLGERFQGLAGAVSETLGAISDALVAGDIGLAAKVLWATLKVAWQEGAYSLQRIWMTLSQDSLKRLTDLKWATIAFSNDMFRGMQQAANNAAYGILKAWNWLSSSSKRVWTDAAYAYQKLWIKAQASVTGEDRKITRDKLADLAESYLAEKSDVDREQKDRNAALAASYLKQRAEIQAKHRQEQAWIGKQSLAESTAFEADVDKGLAEARAQLDRAKAEWRETTAQAKGKTAGTPETGAPESIADRIKKAMAGVGDALAALQSQKTSAVGTFNVSAAYGLGQSSAQERTARAAEQTVRELKGIKARVRQGATFA